MKIVYLTTDHPPRHNSYAMTTQNPQLQNLEAPQATPAAPQSVPLTMEERNDLRRKVLRGEKLTTEEARRVFETLRQGQGAAAIEGEAKPKKGGKRRQALSDAQLDVELDKALGLDM